MKTNLRKVVVVALALAALAAAGCQTVKGLGKDIQTGAEKTEQAISK